MRKFLRCGLVGLLSGWLAVGNLSAGATFGQIHSWVEGETLTAADLNAEFENILNNDTPSGMDDYSVDLTQMRAVTDPFPGGTASQATSLAGELERLRFQVLGLKSALQATNVTYWYQTPPTAGTFTISGSSVGINNVTPAKSLDITGTLQASGTTTLSTVTTTGSALQISTNVVISGTLSVGSATRCLIRRTSNQSVNSGDVISWSSKVFDAANDIILNGTSITITTAGYYQVSFCGQFASGEDGTWRQVQMLATSDLSTYLANPTVAYTTNATVSACASVLINSTANETLQFFVDENATGAATLQGSTLNATWVSIARFL